MRRNKARITITLDRDLLKAARAAVRAGHADSLSSWMNAAIAEHAAKERRAVALSDAIADYEREFGKITPEEIAMQRRLDRANAIRVRSKRRTRRAG